MRFRRFLLVVFSVSSIAAFAQRNNMARNIPINTSVPFLTLAPDARSGALGDAGVATSADPMAIKWNAAKLAFLENDMGASISYNPWLRKLVDDMALSYLTAYRKLSKQEAISLQLTYFDLGKITFTDYQGGIIREHRAKEFSMGGAYSRKLSEHMSVGIGLKFIHSNLGNIDDPSAASSIKPGNTAAGDIGIFHTKDYIAGGKNIKVNLGANISDIGAKISYSNSQYRNFIPTALRLGTAITTDLDVFNKLTLIVELSKLMVPSPVSDSSGFGYSSDKGLLSGMFGSFSDAEGGLSEELKEIIYHLGLEYWYHDARGLPLFAIRAGYHLENNLRGGRKYLTAGFGFRYQMFGIDFAYLVPTQKNNPLAESLRFTLIFNADSKKRVESIID